MSESDGARDQFIPVRKAELLDALVEHGPLGNAEREQFRQVCRILAAIYHYEYVRCSSSGCATITSTSSPSATRIPVSMITRSRRPMPTCLLRSPACSRSANFVEIPHADIERAHRERKTMKVAVTAALDDFREVRFFRRGHHQETVAIGKWFGLRKEMHAVVVYDDVVLFVATKPAKAIAARRERKLLARRRIRPGSVLIKYFRNIAATDLNALFPNVRVTMSIFDALVLGRSRARRRHTDPAQSRFHADGAVPGDRVLSRPGGGGGA